MPIFRNALAERLIRKQAQSYNISGAIRRARSIDPNNIAASLERQTSRLVGANKSAQGAVAEAITRNPLRRTPGTFAAPTAAQTNPNTGSGSDASPGVKVQGGIASASKILLRTYTTRKVVGGQLVEITTRVYLLGGKTYVEETIRVIGQANRPQ